jgi:diguanylate cyclase (GGDEF)-like protein/PAS domain S-box-containing protein
MSLTRDMHPQSGRPADITSGNASGTVRSTPSREVDLDGQARLLELVATGTTLAEALEAIVRWVESQSVGLSCSILLLDPDGRLRHGAAPSLPARYNEAIDGIVIGPDVGSCGTAAYTGEPVIVEDVQIDPRWAGYRDLALRWGLRACWSTPIRSRDGRVVGTFAMYYGSPQSPTRSEFRLIDIATKAASLAIEREASERQVAELARRNQLLLESAGDGLYAVDLHDRVTLVNPAAARMLGWEASELIGRQIHALIHHTKPDGSPYPFDECPRAVAGAVTAEELLWRRDGTSFPVECTVTPLLADGEIVGSAVTFHDISRRRQLEDDLRTARRKVEQLLKAERALRRAAEASEVRFRDLVQGLDAVVWEADGIAYRTTFVSDRARDMLGYEPSDYLADPQFWENHVHPDDLAQAVAASDAAIHDLRAVVLEYRFMAADGRWVWINDRVRVTTDPSGRSRRLTGVMIDVSERKRLESELERQAFEDALTGLPNRALFMDRLRHALERRRGRRRRTAVLFIDIDGLKLINDTLGHEAGDDVLREVAHRLKQSARVSDTVARLGGDEFTMLLEDLTSDQDVREVATRLEARLRAPMLVGSREMSVTASIGIALADAGMREPEVLLQRADIAMYRAKQDGKNRSVVYEEAMAAKAWARLDLELDLRRAIERSELRVFYQPIVDVATSRIIAVEALVRWQHPDRGLLAPAEFIGLAEENGLIVSIGALVLEQASRHVVEWQKAGAADLTLNVNVSARQFQEAGLVDDIVASLERTGLRPDHLRLEITEGVMLTDPDAARQTMTSLRDLGIGVVVDDFGTGYSSLGYLKAFPLDGLKIDRSFIAGLGENAEDGVIVTAAIAIGRAFNLPVTAEGIETADQLAELRRLNCDQGQGYIFSRPLAAEEIAPLVLRA